MNDKDYYEILGVTQDMTRLEIKKVFERLTHIYHPDKGLIKDPTKFKEINKASSVLGDKNKRAAYDVNYGKVSTSSSVSGGSAAASAGATQRSSQPRYGTQRKDYTTSHSTSYSGGSATYNNPSGGTTPGAAPSSPSSSGPQKSSNSLLALWYQFTYYTGQLLSFLGQAVVGVFVFFILYGIIAPIIDLVLWIFGNRHWLTETFIGLFFFSGILAILLFVVSEAMGSPKHRKVSYVMGVVSLVVFLVGEGIPAAYSHRFGGSDVADTHEIHEIIPVAVTEGSSYVNNASYLQNKQNLTYSEVKALQTALAKDKSIYPEGYITGTYGELTHNALIRFQKKYGLSSEGYYGPQTEAKIKEVFGVTTAVVRITTKNTAAAPTPVAQEYLTLRFVNQYGISYETHPNSRSMWNSKTHLTDTLDETVVGKFRWDQKNGYFKFDQKISEKQYNVVWEAGATEYEIDPSDYRSDAICRGHDSGSQLITYKKNATSPIVVTIPQLGTEYSQLYTIISVINEVGTPVSYVKGGIYDSNNNKIGSVWTFRGEEATHSYSWGYNTLPGVYTLEITAPSYKQKILSVTIPDLSKLTNTQIIALPKIDLGDIVLEKE